MSQTEIKNLLTRLHDTFAGNAPSPQINELMQKMEQHLKSSEVDPEISDTASDLLLEVEAENPNATIVVLDIIELLDKMGI
jgi:hypothetical protein